MSNGEAWGETSLIVKIVSTFSERPISCSAEVLHHSRVPAPSSRALSRWSRTSWCSSGWSTCSSRRRRHRHRRRQLRPEPEVCRPSPEFRRHRRRPTSPPCSESRWLPQAFWTLGENDPCLIASIMLQYYYHFILASGEVLSKSLIFQLTVKVYRNLFICKAFLLLVGKYLLHFCVFRHFFIQSEEPKASFQKDKGPGFKNIPGYKVPERYKQKINLSCAAWVNRLEKKARIKIIWSQKHFLIQWPRMDFMQLPIFWHLLLLWVVYFVTRYWKWWASCLVAKLNVRVCE